MKRFWHPETGFFLLLWLILMIGGRSRFFKDPGTFWHTVVGEQMLSGHRLIFQDSFSFTFAGQRWSPHQWLGECLMALVHRLDGLDSLLLSTVTLLACLYTWLASRLLRAGFHWAAVAVLVALTIGASSSHFHIRSHLGTIVGLACTFAFLIDFDDGRIGAKHMFWLIPVYALWTNIHGGMLGGLATMIFATSGWAVWKMLGLPSPLVRYRDLAPLALLIVCCALTAFVNPYGMRLPEIWLEIMDSPVLPQIIQEHAPLNLAKPDGIMVALFAAIYLLCLAGVMPQWPRVSWLLPLIWLVEAWSRVRHGPLFAITAALAVADMFPSTRWAAWLSKSGSDLFQYPVRRSNDRQSRDWRPALLPGLLVLTAFVLQVFHWPVPIIGHEWARLDPNYWPVETLPTLRQFEQSRSQGTRLFNEYLFGGFLIYQTPGYRVFIDDRCELYGDNWLKEYVDAETSGTEAYIEECQTKFGPMDFALTRTGSGFDRYFAHAPSWRLLHEGSAANFYERRRPTNLDAPSANETVQAQ
jgi:hypothetical protein